MTETQEKYYLEKLKQGVENKLQWGNSEDWRHSDYKNLSEVIYNESKILLSTSTLKRVWGKIKYEGMPNATTLDALSMFIGFTNWLDFKNRADETFIENREKSKTIEKKYPQQAPAITLPIKQITLFIGGAIVITGLIFILKSFTSIDNVQKVEIPENFVFEVSKAPDAGIPQTVMIDIDISGFIVDSLYLVESSRKRKEYLSKNQKRHPYFCALPGSQSVTLMFKDQVIKKLEFYVQTDGWQAVTSNKNKGSDKHWMVNLPTFLPASPIEDGSLTITKATLSKHNVEVHDNLWTSFYNFTDLGIDADNYSMTTRIKNSFEDGATTCQLAVCSIATEKGLHEVWLVAPGCSKFTHLLFGSGSMLDNKVVDLSGFEVDMNKWQDLAWKVKDKSVEVFLNGKEVYKAKYKTSLGKIKGLKYQFKGAGGKVDYLRLRDNEGKLLYQNEFDEEVELITSAK